MNKPILNLSVLFVLLGGAPLYAQGYTATVTQTIWELNSPRNDTGPQGAITNSKVYFEAESPISANPTVNTAEYGFDYKIVQNVDCATFSGQLSYFVNSKDGSMAFEKETLRQLIPNGAATAAFTPHFAIRKANGDMLICGQHRQWGNVGITMGKSEDPRFYWADIYWNQMQFLNNIAATPQNQTLPPGYPWESTVSAYRSKVPTSDGREQFLKMYFSNFPSEIPTSVPLMGLGVGIFKNYRQYINQLLLYSVAEQIRIPDGGRADLTCRLLGLYKANAQFQPQGYRVTTFPTQQGLEASQQVSDYLMRQMQEIAHLQQQRKECDKGTDGKPCRERIDAEIRRLRNGMNSRVGDFKQQHKIPD